MNDTQTLLIKAIHAGALELTKHNADAVLALYRAMKEFIGNVPSPDDDLKADYDAVGKWLAFALRKGTGAPDEVTDAELLAAVDDRPVIVMQSRNEWRDDVIRRIEMAIRDFCKHTMDKPRKIVLGPLAARQLYRWAVDEMARKGQSEILNMTINGFFDQFTYRGMSVELTTEAIDVRITD
jgi:hypothetical protein